MMLERLLIALFVLAVGVLVYRLYTQSQIRRTAAFAPTDPLLRQLKPGIPAILYFTTPYCAPCRTQQMPALQRLQSALGDSVQIITVDASENPNDASRWGVFSAPTTFVLDPSGQTRAVNHGVADDRRLRQQLLEATSHS